MTSPPVERIDSLFGGTSARAPNPRKIATSVRLRLPSDVEGEQAARPTPPQMIERGALNVLLSHRRHDGSHLLTCGTRSLDYSGQRPSYRYIPRGDGVVWFVKFVIRHFLPSNPPHRNTVNRKIRAREECNGKSRTSRLPRTR
jgi:hypothetical protein